MNSQTMSGNFLMQVYCKLFCIRTAQSLLQIGESVYYTAIVYRIKLTGEFSSANTCKTNQ